MADLPGAGLTIPLAQLQMGLGNELGLKQHNTLLNTFWWCFNPSSAKARSHRQRGRGCPNSIATPGGVKPLSIHHPPASLSHSQHHCHSLGIVVTPLDCQSVAVGSQCPAPQGGLQECSWGCLCLCRLSRFHTDSSVGRLSAGLVASLRLLHFK